MNSVCLCVKGFGAVAGCSLWNGELFFDNFDILCSAKLNAYEWTVRWACAFFSLSLSLCLSLVLIYSIICELQNWVRNFPDTPTLFSATWSQEKLSSHKNLLCACTMCVFELELFRISFSHGSVTDWSISLLSYALISFSYLTSNLLEIELEPPNFFFADIPSVQFDFQTQNQTRTFTHSWARRSWLEFDSMSIIRDQLSHKVNPIF